MKKLTKPQVKFLQTLKDGGKVSRSPYGRVASALHPLKLVAFTFATGWYITAEGLKALDEVGG